MSNIESVVESVDVIIDAYVASWNETDPAKRQSALAASCAKDARYRDPVMVSDGQAGLDAMLAGVQAKFPGFVLKRISKVDSHNDAVRFAWSLGPASGPSVAEGVDFATLSSDGKLANIVGFIDKMPG
jgi:SnoaL-like domain